MVCGHAAIGMHVVCGRCWVSVQVAGESHNCVSLSCAGQASTACTHVPTTCVLHDVRQALERKCASTTTNPLSCCVSSTLFSCCVSRVHIEPPIGQSARAFKPHPSPSPPCTLYVSTQQAARDTYIKTRSSYEQKGRSTSGPPGWRPASPSKQGTPSSSHTHSQLHRLYKGICKEWRKEEETVDEGGV